MAVRRPHDAIVIGGGHNGLIAGAYLARAGLSTLILERREEVGGAALLAHHVGRLRPSVIRELRLGEHGLELVRPEVRAFAPQPDGRAVTLWDDPARTVEELRPWSRRDADAYPRFDAEVRTVGRFLGRVHAATPPDLVAPSLSDALAGLRLWRGLRKLGDRQVRALFRVLPMAVADLVADAFETDALRAAIATRGVRYAAMGPRSMGTAAVLLADSAEGEGGAAGQATLVRGGPRALAGALASAARSFGAVIRTGEEVVRVATAGGRASGVVLASGQELPARVVVSCADPKRTLLSLVDPAVLGPTLVWRAGNLRMPGVVARVDLHLAALPRFVAARGEEALRLSGRIVIAPGLDALERAFDASKYGRTSTSPYLDATIPSLADPGQAPGGRHLMSVLVQYAPYHLVETSWDAERDGLGDLVLKTLEEYAPGIADRVLDREVVTPMDLERTYGLTEGHPLHGEPGLDQLFAWRPLLGYARYRLHPPGLYLCGSGAHPGGGVTGGPGQNAAREVLADWKRRRR